MTAPAAAVRCTAMVCVAAVVIVHPGFGIAACVALVLLAIGAAKAKEER